MSTQNTSTPKGFVEATEEYFNIRFGVDLAGDKSNKKAPHVITEKMDSFKSDWQIMYTAYGWGWLNPDFQKLSKWIDKCVQEKEAGAKFVTIWPLSGDLNQIPVYKNAQVHIVHGRIWPLVRGCMLCRWEKGITPSVSGVRWDKNKLVRLW